MIRRSPIRLPRIQWGLRTLFVATAMCAVAVWWWCQSSEAAPRRTGRDLDLSIFGRGYFQASNPDSGESCFTRCGRLSLDANGDLVVGRPADHWKLEPQISVPPDWTDIQVNCHGIVSARETGSNSWQQLGAIEIARFINPDGLLEIAPQIYRETDDSGPATLGQPGRDGLGYLVQGWAEDRETLPLDLRLLAELVIGAAIIALLFQIHQLRKRVEAVAAVFAAQAVSSRRSEFEGPAAQAGASSLGDHGPEPGRRFGVRAADRLDRVSELGTLLRAFDRRR